MIRGGEVVFTYEWERPPLLPGGDYDYIEIQVTARISDFWPANRAGPHGAGQPAEGGEVEDLTVYLPTGRVLDPIPERLFDDLCDRALMEHMS